jgi:membrane protease subunit (stomatin/prohibitin family)
VSLPDEVQAHLDKGSSMRAVGNLDQYAKFQAAEALEKAAGQSGGIAGIGAGIAAAGALGGTMNAALSTPAAAAAAPAEDPFALIEKLHKLLTIGALSQEEFDAKKSELLARLK